MSSRAYFDHAATSFPKAPGVADAVGRFLANSPGNPGRGGHALAIAAARMVAEVREQAADLLGGHPERTFFGPGATFWLNTVLGSILQPGARVITSALEHNAVMRPLRQLERERGVEIAVVRGRGADGVPEPEEVARAVAAAPTRAVVLTHVSNVSGAVLPIAAIARAVAPVPVVVDGAQGAGSLPFDFADSGVAAYACSAHKGLLGPTGTGLLLLAPDLAVDPLVRGGTGSRSESEEMPGFAPDCLEAGTPNTVGIAGLGAALRWIEREGLGAIRERGRELGQRLADGLRSISGVRLHGHAEGRERLALVSFTCEGIDSGVLAAFLDRERGCMLRVGLHCSPAAHRRLETFPDGTLRASLGPFNTAAQVDVLVAAVDAARGSL